MSTQSQSGVTAEASFTNSLAELIAHAPERRLPIEQTLRIAEQICMALETIHTQGLAFGRPSPRSVRFLAGGQVALVPTDPYSLVQDASAQGAGGPDAVAYIAPELALGDVPNAHSDLYALGAMLYELVTERAPFPGDDRITVISQHITAAPVAPSWHNPYVPKPLDWLILRMLAKNPADRPESAALVRQELASISIVAGSPFREAQRQERAAANPLDRLAADVFVGREMELRQLRAAFDAALDRRSGVVLLAGEPGIGKTSLTEETMTYARLHGARVLLGHCYEWEGAPAYWPWVQMIRAWAEVGDPERMRADLGTGAAVIAEIVPELREWFPRLPEAPRMEGEQARFRLFESIAGLLRNLTARQPLLLVLDDLHWADAPSLLLLQFVTRECERSRALFVGTFRDVEVDRRHPLSTTLAELARRPRALRVTLSGLTGDDIARFIALTTGSEPDPLLVEAVERETNGNPFFVSEVVRLLAAEGRLGRASRQAMRGVTIPESVRDVVVRRLDRLSAECNDVLGIASVVGREFTLPVLAWVSGNAPDVLLNALEEATRARLIEAEAPAQRYRFTHALVQDTLYAEVGAGRRLRLHAAVGEALEQIQAADLAPYYGELAHHFGVAAPAGYAQRAVDYAARAGDRALEQLAWEPAIEHYGRALLAMDLLSEPDPARRCDVLLALGAAHYHTVLDISDSEEGRSAYLQAAEIARSIGSFERLARAALDFAGINVVKTSGGLQQVRLLEDALALAPAGDSALKARIMARLAIDLRLLPNTEERGARLSEDALAMARRLGDPATLAYVLIARSSVIWGPDSVEERLAVVREAGHAAAQVRDSHNQIWSHLFSSSCLYELGDRQGFVAELDASLRAGQESRIPYFLWGMGSVNPCGRAILEGRFDDAQALIDAMPGVESQTLVTVFYRSTLLFLLEREQGRQTIHADSLQEAIALTSASIDPFDRHRGHVLRALRLRWLRETGQIDAARTTFEAFAGRGFADLPKDAYWLATLVLLAEVAAIINDRLRGELLYDLLMPYAGRNAVATNGLYFGSVACYLGVLAACLTRWDEAEQHFDAALSMNVAMHARPALARTQHAYAAMLRQRGAPRDRERAVALLESALAATQELGMLELVEWVASLLADIQASPTASAPFALSARELEVLLLIVAGRTDREIAVHLFVGRRTVTTHVTNILNKLGVDSRTEATAVALRSGLAQ